RCHMSPGEHCEMHSRIDATRSKLQLLLITTLALLAAVWVAGPAPALAQDEPAAATAEPAEGTPAPAADQPATGTSESAPAVETTTMLEMIAGGLGLVWGTIFLLLSLIMVAI